MEVVKVKIHSDLRKEGQIYQVSDEVEQELEMNQDGKVSLHALSHEGLPCWEEEKEMSEEDAKEILHLISIYLENPNQIKDDHVGQWTLEASYADGSIKKVSGPMLGKVEANGIDLTQLIRKKCPFLSLGVFDQTDSL